MPSNVLSAVHLALLKGGEALTLDKVIENKYE